jgi:hypothetical protein
MRRRKCSNWEGWGRGKIKYPMKRRDKIIIIWVKYIIGP